MKKQLERKRESIHEITVQKREWYINVSIPTKFIFLKNVIYSILSTYV